MRYVTQKETILEEPILYLIRGCIRLIFTTLYVVTDITSQYSSILSKLKFENGKLCVKKCRSPLATSFRLKVLRKLSYSRRCSPSRGVLLCESKPSFFREKEQVRSQAERGGSPIVAAICPSMRFWPIFV